MLVEKYASRSAKLIVVYDELDLPWTGVRIRPKGSAGGHHGIEDVIKTPAERRNFPGFAWEFIRAIRSGMERSLCCRHFEKAQMQDLDELLDHAAAATESIIAEGAEKAMTKFNRRARGLTKEEE